MEKRKNFRNDGLWVVKDHDGLYLCNQKPWKNFSTECEFSWCCEGDFIKIDNLKMYNEKLFNLKMEDEPVEIYPLTQDEYYQSIKDRVTVVNGES